MNVFEALWVYLSVCMYIHFHPITHKYPQIHSKTHKYIQIHSKHSYTVYLSVCECYECIWVYVSVSVSMYIHTLTLTYTHIHSNTLLNTQKLSNTLIKLTYTQYTQITQIHSNTLITFTYTEIHGIWMFWVYLSVFDCIWG